ncbi:XRE family transcriptional regulator [Actinomyces urogenitalis]|uniref:XRE family transcriptional regulator n=1 Tax=Actinomyces urogenitalis TaxID=103621 RepID=UPI0024306F0E|nr:XRE family transcriptional regulator [Actinomyces urogenitalis]MCI7457602.1 XRE family transcriptional regulator [Actinomyces urogenitalis]
MNQPSGSARHWNGTRLRHLAELEGTTMGDLGQNLGLSNSAISRMVLGQQAVPNEIVREAIRRFDLPESFFAIHTADLPGRSSLPRDDSSNAYRDKRLLRLFHEAWRTWRVAARASHAPRAPLPTGYTDPEQAAVAVRQALGMNEHEPVRNMVRLAERLGVAVIDGLDPHLEPATLPGASPARDAITIPGNTRERALIATIRPLPGAVQRVAVAQQLGLLVRSQRLSTPPTSSQRRWANAFAGALLLPERVMRKQVDQSTTLAHYLCLKAQFGVGTKWIARRAKHLGLIDPQRERSLVIQIGSRDWNTIEPVQVAREEPMFLLQALEHAWPGEPALHAAEAVGLPENLLRAWVGLEPIYRQPCAVIDLAAWRSKRAM